jgi:hypothetical protein
MGLVKNKNSVLVLILGAMLLLSGCWFQNDDKKTDEIADTPGIEYYGVDIEVLSETDGVDKSVTANRSIIDEKILYLARIVPPVVDGVPVQSNMVRLSENGKLAFAAYNTAGETARGAIQIINVAPASILTGLIRGTLSIKAEIKFPDMDINSLYYDEETGDLLFGASVEDWSVTTAGSQTYLGKINVNGSIDSEAIKAGLIPLNSITTVIEGDNIGSNAVTAITATPNYYYISVASNKGGIIKIGKDLNINNAVFTPYIDVRSIVSYNENVYALKGAENNAGNAVEGTPSMISYISNSWSVDSSITQTMQPGYKATIDLYKDPSTNPNNLIFLGLSEGGMKIMSMDKASGALEQKGHANNPSLPAGSALRADTNSVSYYDKLVFSANGNYGFRIFKNNGSVKAPNFGIVGYHNMQQSFYKISGDLQYSANDIAYRNNVLFVASGQYGVCVYYYFGK